MRNTAKYDFLIIGSGLFGCTFAHEATKNGKRCLIIEKKDHIGGNVYCENIEGINIHRYGAHIFHTSDKDIWNYVNRFVRFNRYTNSPLAAAPDGKLYNLPFNMNTFYQLWGIKTPEEALTVIEEQKKCAIFKLNGRQPENLEEQALVLVGKDIFEKLIKGYTEKQWGRKCTDLPPDIIRRLPIRLSFDNNYFNDTYQGIPIGGYNELISGLIDGVEIINNCNYFDVRSELDNLADKIIYTGPIDQFFEHRFGMLEYRSLDFVTETIHKPNYQGNAVINYTQYEIPYTRIIEHKHFETFGTEIYTNPYTVITKEFPKEWSPACEPFYPINDSRNSEIYSRYLSLATSPEFNKKYYFGGRLGTYRYLDMAPVIKEALMLYQSIINGKHE